MINKKQSIISAAAGISSLGFLAFLLQQKPSFAVPLGCIFITVGFLLFIISAFVKKD